MTKRSESLALSLQAYKSLIESYLQRASQAETMITLLMEQIPKDELMSKLVNNIADDMLQRAQQQAVQYRLVIENTLLALIEIQKDSGSDDLIDVIKALTITTSIK